MAPIRARTGNCPRVSAKAAFDSGTWSDREIYSRVRGLSGYQFPGWEPYDARATAGISAGRRAAVTRKRVLWCFQRGKKYLVGVCVRMGCSRQRAFAEWRRANRYPYPTTPTSMNFTTVEQCSPKHVDVVHGYTVPRLRFSRTVVIPLPPASQ